MEVWKDVVGYEGQYQVSNYGRVKSLPRLAVRPQGNYMTKERILKPQPVKGGYLAIRPRKDGIRLSKLIHVLVAEAFIPNPENKPEVNHKDLDKTNNHVDNLEWNTRSENMKHAYDNGVVDVAKALKFRHSKEEK